MKNDCRLPEICVFSIDINGVWMCKVTNHPCGKVDLCPESDEFDEMIERKVKQNNDTSR